MFDYLLKCAADLEKNPSKDTRLALAAIDNALKIVIADDMTKEFYEKLSKFLEDVGDNVPRGYGSLMKTLQDTHFVLKDKVENPSKRKKRDKWIPVDTSDFDEPKEQKSEEEWEDVDSDFSTPKSTKVPTPAKIPYIPSLSRKPVGTSAKEYTPQGTHANPGLGENVKDMFKNMFTSSIVIDSITKTADTYDRAGHIGAANILDGILKNIK